MATVSQKNQAKVIQTRLKELGFDVMLGHAYEVIAALDGEKSWNVTSSKLNKGSLNSEIPSEKEVEILEPEKHYPEELEMDDEGKYEFTIGVRSLIHCDASIRMKANSKEEAVKRVEEAVYEETIDLHDVSYWSVDNTEALNHGRQPEVFFLKKHGAKVLVYSWAIESESFIRTVNDNYLSYFEDNPNKTSQDNFEDFLQFLLYDSVELEDACEEYPEGDLFIGDHEEDLIKAVRHILC